VNDPDWSVDKLDLDAYLDRIGYQGPAEASEEVLAGLYRAHLAAVRFENLDVFLRGRVDVDLGSIQDKIVFRGRGGYCYEQAQLFDFLFIPLHGISPSNGRLLWRRGGERPCMRRL